MGGKMRKLLLYLLDAIAKWELSLGPLSFFLDSHPIHGVGLPVSCITIPYTCLSVVTQGLCSMYSGANVNTMVSVLKPEKLEMQKKCFSYISDWPKIHFLIYFV